MSRPNPRVAVTFVLLHSMPGPFGWYVKSIGLQEWKNQKNSPQLNSIPHTTPKIIGAYAANIHTRAWMYDDVCRDMSHPPEAFVYLIVVQVLFNFFPCVDM